MRCFLSLDWGIMRGVNERPDVLVVLVLPDSTEARWVWERPRIGSEIKSRLGKKWRVEEVVQSGDNLYTVHCVPPSRGVRAHRISRRISSTERERRCRYDVPEGANVFHRRGRRRCSAD